MKNKNILKSLLSGWSLVIFTLIGCMPSNQNQPINTPDNNCIQPKVGFAFPANSGKENFLPKDSIPPLAPWQEIASPLALERDKMHWDAIRFSRTTNDDSVELWLTRVVQWGVTFEEMQSALLIFQPQTAAWREVPDAFQGFSPVINNLFLADSGEIWALGQIPSTSDSANPISNGNNVLGIFNEDDQKFQPLIFPEALPDGLSIFDRTRNLFWVFDNNELYKVDPVKFEIDKQIGLPSLSILATTVSPDGSIYVLNRLNIDKWTQDSVEILKLDPENNTIEKIKPEGSQQTQLIYLEPFQSIFADKSGSLWLGDQAWRASDGIWYQVLRSPVFITHFPEGGPSYTWDLPTIILESSDGRLWFNSFNGIVWLDPQKGQWCWFTTYHYNTSITEDSEHNLWMLADGKLYELALEK